MPTIRPCQTVSSSASAGCTTVCTASAIKAHSHWNVCPSTVTAAASVPPAMGANACEKLLTMPGQNSVAR